MLSHPLIRFVSFKVSRAGNVTNYVSLAFGERIVTMNASVTMALIVTAWLAFARALLAGLGQPVKPHVIMASLGQDANLFANAKTMLHVIGNRFLYFNKCK